MQELISDWFEAFSRGDGAWLHRHVSREADVRLIGTDPNEWLEGQRAGEFLKGVAETIGGDVEISPGEPVAVREGDVGWGITRPTFTLPDGREIKPRLTDLVHAPFDPSGAGLHRSRIAGTKLRELRLGGAGRLDPGAGQLLRAASPRPARRSVPRREAQLLTV